MKKYNVGGLLKGPSHEEGGIPILAEGGEVIVNDAINMRNTWSGTTQVEFSQTTIDKDIAERNAR